MTLDKEQLAVVLQACVDFAKQLIKQNGGFLPFGARVRPGGEVEFLQLQREGEEEALEDYYRRTGAALADEARKDELLGAALIANVNLPDELDGEFEIAVAVLIEAPDFCRSILVPYRAVPEVLDGGTGTVELGKMIPQAADRVVFAD
jgi:hypothetical protein